MYEQEYTEEQVAYLNGYREAVDEITSLITSVMDHIHLAGGTIDGWLEEYFKRLREENHLPTL